MQHLVIDARSLRDQRDGLGTYLTQLVPRIVAQAVDLDVTILASPSKTGFWESAAPRASVLACDCRPMWPGQNWIVPRLLGTLRPDVYFYPVHDPPLLTRAPFVFVIQDVTPHILRPYHPKLDRAKHAYTWTMTAIGLRRAARVLVTTQATKTAVGKYFGAGLLEKIDVVALAAEDHAQPFASGAGVRDRLLYVGTDQPQKNLDRLILAYAQAAERLDELPALEIVGMLRREQQLRELIATTAVAGSISLLGHVSDRELEDAYARALAVVFPSLAEGFGLPVLEAMGRSIPLITSERTACAEVAGGAAVLVDPYDVASIADGIVAVVSRPQLRAALAVRGRARAAQFSWDRCAAETLQTLRPILQRS